jgi:hypothetical protein
MHQIGDDLFWLPADFKPKKDYTIEDVLTGFEEVKPNGKEIKKFSQILQEFQGS